MRFKKGLGARPFGGLAGFGGTVITAVLAPVGAQMRAGGTIGGIANIATFRNTANYAASGGQTITSVVVRVNGIARPDLFSLGAGDAVSLLVTASDGTARVWELLPSVPPALTPMTVLPPAPQRIAVGTAASLDVSGAFVSSYPPLTFAVSDATPLPAGVSFAAPHISFSGGNALVPGGLLITIEAMDAEGQTASCDFSFTLADDWIVSGGTGRMTVDHMPEPAMLTATGAPHQITIGA